MELMMMLCRLVLAVDPAELQPSALKPNVVHLRAKAQDAAEQANQHLAAHGCSLDLLVCDMNYHPVQAAKVGRAGRQRW